MGRKKRAHGEGMMRERVDGRWEGRISYWDGNRLRVKSVYGRTQREAQQKLVRLRAQLQRGCCQPRKSSPSGST